MDPHNKDVISGFTKQASTFHDISSHSNDYSLNLMIRFSEPTIYDTVLDEACGNGTVAFEYAKIVKHVTGIDIIPAMIKSARNIQKERHLDNLDWRIGDISNSSLRFMLPSSFFITTTIKKYHDPISHSTFSS